MEVRYMGHKDRPLHERQSRMVIGCKNGHVEIAYPSTGLSLLLSWQPGATSQTGSGGNYCDMQREPGKAHIVSSLILNGVCVRWTGWIDLVRLDGMGRLEMDEALATSELE